MKRPVLNKRHPLYQTYIDFHLGRFKGSDRVLAKVKLFPIHYGDVDTSEADKLIAEKRLQFARAL